MKNEKEIQEIDEIVSRIREGRKRLGKMQCVVLFGDDWPDLDRLSEIAKKELQ